MVGTPLSVVLRRDSRAATCAEPGRRLLARAPSSPPTVSTTCSVVTVGSSAVAGEDVRMASHELVADRLDRVGDGEVAGLLANLREEHRLVEVVAELLAQVRRRRRSRSPRALRRSLRARRAAASASVCSRSQGQPSGARSARMISTRRSNVAPAFALVPMPVRWGRGVSAIVLRRVCYHPDSL